jgi:flagellar protein FlaG
MGIGSVHNATSAVAVAAHQSNFENANAAIPSKEQLAKAAALTEQAPPAVNDAKPSNKELADAVKSVNDFVNSVNKSLQFSVDDDTGKTVVKVIDTETKQLIKQFPSEEMLAIAKALDRIKGLLVHQKA